MDNSSLFFVGTSTPCSSSFVSKNWNQRSSMLAMTSRRIAPTNRDRIQGTRFRPTKHKGWREQRNHHEGKDKILHTTLGDLARETLDGVRETQNFKTSIRNIIELSINN